MESDTAASARANRQRPPLQFSLRQLFLVVTGVSICCSTIAYAGAVGAAVFFLAAGILSVWIGVQRDRPFATQAGASMLFLECVLGLLCGYSGPVGSGHCTLPVRFVILDAATKQPIGGAVVRIRRVLAEVDRPKVQIPPGEPGVEGRTGPQGTVTLRERFRTGCGSSAFESWDRVYFSYDFWIQVSAPGYETFQLSLDEHTGRSRDLDAGPLPPITIELVKSPASGKADPRGTAPPDD